MLRERLFELFVRKTYCLKLLAKQAPKDFPKTYRKYYRLMSIS
jgi:hypothetical protein